MRNLFLDVGRYLGIVLIVLWHLFEKLAFEFCEDVHNRLSGISGSLWRRTRS